MADKPEALRLADRLEDAESARLHLLPYAADELRRLHEAHDWQYKMAGDRLRRIEKLEAVNAELLEALNKLVDHIDFIPTDPYYRNETKELMDAARAAIAKAEEQK
jgi:hypothetical protein